MTAGDRDKRIEEIANAAATAFCRKYERLTTDGIEGTDDPQKYLQSAIPYLTVRTLHRLEETLKRHEIALRSLEKDSRWIKWFAIATGALTVVLVFLTIVLAKYQLLELIHPPAP